MAKKLAIGVDRVDYSKGLVNRIQRVRSSFHRSAATQARGLAVADRNAIARNDRGLRQLAGDELSKLVTDVNGRHGEVDWTPIRYLSKGFSRDGSGRLLPRRPGGCGDAAS